MRKMSGRNLKMKTRTRKTLQMYLMSLRNLCSMQILHQSTQILSNLQVNKEGERAGVVVSSSRKTVVVISSPCFRRGRLCDLQWMQLYARRRPSKKKDEIVPLEPKM